MTSSPSVHSPPSGDLFFRLLPSFLLLLPNFLFFPFFNSNGGVAFIICFLKSSITYIKEEKKEGEGEGETEEIRLSTLKKKNEGKLPSGKFLKGNKKRRRKYFLRIRWWMDYDMMQGRGRRWK